MNHILHFATIKKLLIFSAQIFFNQNCLTDTGEDSKLVHRRKRLKVDKLFSSLFFPTRPSDDHDSAPTRKDSRPLLDVSAYIGYLLFKMNDVYVLFLCNRKF